MLKKFRNFKNDLETNYFRPPKDIEDDLNSLLHSRKKLFSIFQYIFLIISK